VTVESPLPMEPWRRTESRRAFSVRLELARGVSQTHLVARHGDAHHREPHHDGHHGQRDDDLRHREARLIAPARPTAPRHALFKPNGHLLPPRNLLDCQRPNGIWAALTPRYRQGRCHCGFIRKTRVFARARPDGAGENVTLRDKDEKRASQR